MLSLFLKVPSPDTQPSRVKPQASGRLAGLQIATFKSRTISSLNSELYSLLFFPMMGTSLNVYLKRSFLGVHYLRGKITPSHTHIAGLLFSAHTGSSSCFFKNIPFLKMLLPCWRSLPSDTVGCLAAGASCPAHAIPHAFPRRHIVVRKTTPIEQKTTREPPLIHYHI